MIRCTPRGICSWNFYLEGDGHQAILEINWLGEQGAIIEDDVTFEIRKNGMFSGYWTLNRDGQEIVSAQKSTPFTRTFEIQCTDGNLLLRAESAFCRGFCIERSGDVIATIYPAHPLTRRATIETGDGQLDFNTICFCFWLVVLTWRRAASNNS